MGRGEEIALERVGSYFRMGRCSQQEEKEMCREQRARQAAGWASGVCIHHAKYHVLRLTQHSMCTGRRGREKVWINQSHIALRSPLGRVESRCYRQGIYRGQGSE